MTPRSFARTPSVSAEDASEPPPPSEYDSGDESLPPHTSEIGTLKKLPNHGTAWLGSSSGVYFVNTVRRAFSAALIDCNTATAIPASEDILTGDDADGRNYNGPITDGLTAMEGDFRRVVLASLGRPPADRELAMELVTTFFRCWHPLFPFLHGPRFLQDIDAIYAMPDLTATRSFTPIESRRVVTFQLIINIASLDRTDIQLPIESRVKSTSDVSRVAGCFSVNHDIAAIQLLIAAELYLVATISLRQASTVAGMILKMIYHAGLHRCPLRYAQLSLEDCEIRKRIFWSAYALDRHLSLSLGDPNTVQDNDIDVCLSGRELHKAVAHELIINPNDELKMHLPHPQAGPHGSGSPLDDPRVVNLNDGPQAREKAQREAAMTAYVNYGKLTGRIIEIFHKSIHARFQKPEAITFLNSDIETWWNDLPAAFTDEDDDQDMTRGTSCTQSPTANVSQSNTPSNQTGSGGPSPTHKQLSPFFLILYHQLQLLLNRPRLSLDQSTAEFQHGLQICIKASRNTLTALKRHRDYGQSMLLPGLLSATWMAGLIIAFACQLGKYPKLRACADISSCLAVLDNMGNSHWFTVKNCHKVLSLLLENIKSRKASTSGFLGVAQSHQRGDSTVITGQGIPRKRAHDDSGNGGSSVISDPNITSSPKRKSVSEMSPTNSSDFRMPSRPSNTATGGQRTPGGTPIATTTVASSRHQGSIRSSVMSNVDTLNPGTHLPQHNEWPTTTTTNYNSRPASDTSGNSPYMNNHLSYSTTTSTSAPNPMATTGYPTRNLNHNLNLSSSRTNNLSGAAVYADPADITLAQSSHNLNLPAPLPGGTLNIDDPMFWGNFDYNISDIFGAASWENMPGGMGPFSGWGDLSSGGNNNNNNNNGGV